MAGGGCAGSGCTQLTETYTYNNRLQPWMIQLGTSTNSSSDYCLVYNYFSSWTAPSSCPAASSVPTSGTGNNGNVNGYWYQDSVNTAFSHTARYTYDNVNRLTNAVATGNSTYSQEYSYTRDGSTGQYGNMTCTSGCVNMPANLTFSASSNQITSSNYTYDAAGNLTKDASNTTAHTYQWDAEGRVSKVDPSNNPPTWAFTYNALGDRVQWVSPSGTSEYVADPSGNLLGVYGSYGIVMLGARPLTVYASAETWFHHVNNIGSRTMMDNRYGTVTQDMVFYPFGGTWLNWGGGGLEFADLSYYDTNLNTDIAEYRVMSNNLGRWHSPDPIAGDPSNPQSWNMYAYVMNNPASLIDPTGLEWCDPNSAIYDNNGSLMGYDPAGCISDEEHSQSNSPPNYSVYVGGGQTEVTGSAPDQVATEDYGVSGGLSGIGGSEGGLNIINWPQLNQLVKRNNLSNQCDELIDCIVEKESSAPGGFNANAVPPVNPNTGLPTSSARGLMQVTKGAAADVVDNYEGFPSAKELYGQLFDPATNIQVGSAYLQVLVDRFGILSTALAHYGTGNSYADWIQNCVKQLKQGQ